MKLLMNALLKYLFGILIVGALIFIPAGSFEYTNGWIFMSILFIPMFFLGVILFIKSPELLKKRLNSKEKEGTQKGVVAVSGLLFVIGFIVAGLDFRFGWSNIPEWGAWLASAVLLVSYCLYGEVMRENEYLSRTIEVQEGQKVIDTGLYGIVRHPMYAVTIWLFLAIPFVLGSFWAVLSFLPYIAVIAVRTINEEKLLEKELLGYKEYKERVRYRIIPFIW